MVTTIDKDLEAILEQVMDPEVPVLNIVEMGIVKIATRDTAGNVVVSLVPTYTGCPAMRAIELSVGDTLTKSGFVDFNVRTLYHEVWTTDWMTEEALNKLEEYGIAPPARTSSPKGDPSCPFCGSSNTNLTSQFGSTACKSMHFCDSCVQPFEHFKCH